MREVEVRGVAVESVGASGGDVSVVQLTVAGEPVLPTPIGSPANTASVATTVNVCGPSVRPLVAAGDVHDASGAESNEH